MTLCAIKSVALIMNARDEVLLKIGRNVVNFQKIEATLKFLVLWSAVQGDPRNLKETRAKQAKSIRNRAMGQLADSYHQNVYLNESERGQPTDSSTPWISVRFSLEIDPEIAKTRKRELKALVAERNRLIHKDLTYFDFDSEESCSKLVIKLDEQNARILTKLEELRAMRDTFEQFRKELTKIMNTEEFIAAFQHELQRA